MEAVEVVFKIISAGSSIAVVGVAISGYIKWRRIKDHEERLAFLKEFENSNLAILDAAEDFRTQLVNYHMNTTPEEKEEHKKRADKYHGKLHHVSSAEQRRITIANRVAFISGVIPYSTYLVIDKYCSQVDNAIYILANTYLQLYEGNIPVPIPNRTEVGNPVYEEVLEEFNLLFGRKLPNSSPGMSKSAEPVSKT